MDRMRSLYTDDIPGARPVKRVYSKTMKRDKLEEQIFRFAKNPEKHVIDWHVLPRKVKEPLDKNEEGAWRIKKSLDQSFNSLPNTLTQSAMLERAISQRDFDMKVDKNNSVLRESARKSLDKHEDPYFPHRYIDRKMGENNKWSGMRGWQQGPTQKFNLPSVKGEYVGKWK